MPRPTVHARVAAAQAARVAGDGVRVRRRIDQRDGVRVVIDGRELVNFCSNDYLGLAQHADVVGALIEAGAQHGAGSTASHLVCGHHALHEVLEREVAQWLGYPRALLLGSGYAANLAVLQGLLGGDDLCVQDRLNHASLIDGARLAGCRLRRYPHADVEGALRHLVAAPDATALLATDGVFSMDGDVAPLRELALLARSQHALLYVDDAHGIGVLGADGRGSVAAAGLGPQDVPLLLVTLGKALGGYGAVLVGDDALIEHLAQTARPYVYSTALPPAQVAASLAALRTARREGWRRAKLASLVARFQRGAQQMALPLQPSSTPIQPLLLGDNAGTLAAARKLEELGFLVSAIRPPTVPDGSARLRVTLSAAHEDVDIDRLLDALFLACAGKAPAPVAAHRLLNE